MASETLAHNQFQEKDSPKLRKRRRPLTKGIRTELRNWIENAVLDSNSTLLSTVFSPNQPDEMLVAPLPAVLSHLQQIGHNVARAAVLSDFALKSIANRTRIFAIEENPQQKQLIVKVQPHIHLNNDEKTVFVDNLPPLCTAERLKKRAAFFGRVIGVRMPQIGRLQRRIGQMIGGTWPVHSGFAFVQFASKTAAKRFCKRYAMNSRLKRFHHGHKHGRKRTVTAAAATGKSVQQQQQHCEEKALQRHERADGEEMMTDMCNGQLDGEMGGHNNNKQQDAPLPPAVVDETAHYPPLGPVEGQFRCNSVAEESVMSESGNETDAQMGKMREDGKGTGPTGANRTGGEENNNSNRKRKRQRRRPTRNRHPVNHLQTLNSLFRHIQVFPLKQYRELRTEYFRIKKMRMETLKKQLQGIGRKSEEEKHPMETSEKKRMNGEKRDGERRVKRRGRKRGTRKLLGRAERAKVAEYAKNDWPGMNE